MRAWDNAMNDRPSKCILYAEESEYANNSPNKIQQNGYTANFTACPYSGFAALPPNRGLPHGNSSGCDTPVSYSSIQ